MHSLSLFVYFEELIHKINKYDTLNEGSGGI